MEIIFNCPHCQAAIEADSDISGARAECPACKEIVLVPAPGIEVGMELAGYQIDKRVGVGGMGEVFEATQMAMKRRVALKVLPPGVTSDSTLVSRFMHEVQMSGKLEHPSIVTAFDAGMAKGYYYLAMSFVDGEDLDHMLKRDVIPERHGLEICLAVAAGLDYAWRRFSMLHRDIKPANIMIDHDGEVKLMDMGIAKTINEDSNLTMQGSLVGTPYYMSPEQATANSEIDCRADIYSMGATLYYMLTGTKPFDGPNAMSIIAKHISEKPEAPKKRYPELSDACNDLILRMMAKDKNDRPADWTALQEAVNLVLEGHSPGPVEAPNPFAAPDEIPSLRPRGADLEDDDDVGLKPAEEPLNTIEMPDEDPTPILDTPSEDLGSTSPTPTPERNMPQPQFLRGGAGATDVEGFKVGVAAAAGLGVLIVLILVGIIIYIFVAAQNQAAAAKARQKDQEIEELKIAADVEKKLATGSATAEAQVNAEERLKRLRKMFDAAKSFARDNPDDADAIIAQYEIVARNAKGTEYELYVQRELLKHSSKGKDDGEKILRKLRKDSEELAKDGYFGPAAYLLTSYTGPGQVSTAKARAKLAQKYRKDEAENEKLAEFLRVVTRLVLSGDLEKAEEAIREAQDSSDFSGMGSSLSDNIKPLSRIIQLARRHSGEGLQRPPPSGMKPGPVFFAFRALFQKQYGEVRSILRREDGLLKHVLVGESYLHELPGDWQAVKFKGECYREQIKTVKLRLSAKETFRSSINGKKPISGNFRIAGRWICFYRGSNSREYWRISKFDDDELVLRPKYGIDMLLKRE